MPANTDTSDAGRLLRGRPGSLRAAVLGLGLAVAVVCGGCQMGGGQPVIARPARHSVRSEQLLVLSDFKISKNHRLIQDLITLRGQVGTTLNLPLQGDSVIVYLFSDELSYRQYLEATYPGLPPRRAYFVGTPKELAVYTFWGERIQEDLRHEFTHGLLHSALKTVPLWLDEGLAEYFEVTGPSPGTLNAEYTHRLAAAIANGWKPDLERLERLEEFSQMQKFDYQEAWAWVHFMLHTTPEAREALLGYLQDLRTITSPTPLSARLQQEIPEVGTRFLSYLATLPTARTVAGPL